jgi:hypothetical protein
VFRGDSLKGGYLMHCTPAGRGPPAAGPAPRLEDLVCEERLGGFVRHYHRRAA